MSKARDLAASHAGITALAPNATVLNSVAPANGFSRTYNFHLSGTCAVEHGGTAADIPN